MNTRLLLYNLFALLFCIIRVNFNLCLLDPVIDMSITLLFHVSVYCYALKIMIHTSIYSMKHSALKRFVNLMNA